MWRAAPERARGDAGGARGAWSVLHNAEIHGVAIIDSSRAILDRAAGTELVLRRRRQAYMRLLGLAVGLLASVAAVDNRAAGPPNPHSAFASFDCALRRLALEFASHLQPHRSAPELQAIADALNNDTYAECRNLTVAGSPPPLTAPAFPISSLSGKVVYVDYGSGSDSGSGSEQTPLKSIAAALNAVAG